MKSQVKNFTLAVLAVLMVLSAGFAQQAAAQSVSVSPVALSFGIPTGTPAPASLTNVITVTSLGAGPVTLSNFAINGNFASDFTINGNSCTTPQTAPTTCQIGIQFTSTQPAGTLEVATLSFSSSTQTNPVTVPLSGAFGAIKLFDETNVTTTNASFTSLYTIANKSLNLTCPAQPTATISGTPDGSGYVLVDNYMTLATGSSSANLTPVSDPNSTNLPAGNICSGTGATADEGPGGFYADCFTSNYQDTVFEDTDPLLNLDPDTFANPGNQFLTQERPNPNNAGGVPPIDVHSFLGGAPAGTYPELALFTLLTSGFEGVYDNTTLFLVTNCTAPGTVPGSSVTLNPIEPNNPASETQTATFDDSPGQNIGFTSSVGVAISQNPNIITPGTVPIITDFPIPQQLFDQLVTGTSSAPAVCMRMTGELDLSVTPPAPMCKGYLMQCFDPNTGTTSGDNCTNLTTELSARYLLYTAQFSSPDGPVGYNYLTNQPWTAQNPYSVGQTIVDQSGFVQQVTGAGTSGASIPTFNDAANGTTSDGTVTWTFEGVNACLNVGNGSSMACAQGTGPGMLMGSDFWVCNPANPASEGCTEAPNNTQTNPSTQIFSPSECQLTGGLAGALCPLDLMTSFQGAADPAGKAAGKVPNSLFVPVVNMPLPTTKVSIAGQNTNGWVNAPSTATANFTANVAAYPSQGSAIPQANSFSPAAIYTVTAGFSTWPTVPDTTYPIATDLTMSNTATSPTTPFCQVGGTTPLTAFTPSSGLTAINNGNALSDGIYNLHYFPTDCAFTEGLLYNPTPAQVSDPTANWASFTFTTVGVDTQAPTYTCSAPTAVSNGGWYAGNVSVSCTVTDANYVQGVSASGFLPLVDGIQGSQTETIVISTAVPSGTVNPAAMAGPSQACDLAGNCVSVQAGPFMVSVAPPLVITASGGTMVFGGTPPVITPSYMGLESGEAATTTPPTCSTTATSASPVGSYPSTCMGASDSIFGYSISYVQGSVSVTPAPATITLSNLTQAYTGSPLSPTVMTNPSGLSYSLTGAPDTTPNSYPVTATITNKNYSGSTSGIFTITPPPVWTITPSSYNFGTLSVGQKAISVPLAIHNPGTSGVAIYVSDSINGNLGGPGGQPEGFYFASNNCPKTLAGGGTCYVTMSFTGMSCDLGKGTVSAYVIVSTGKTVLVKAQISGQVVDPKIKLSSTSFNFGAQKTGYPVTEQVVTLTNQGPTTFLLSHLALSGSPVFRLANGANECGNNLASGSSCEIYVTFTPAKKGESFSGSLCIFGNPSNGPLSVALKGSGD